MAIRKRMRMGIRKRMRMRIKKSLRIEKDRKVEKTLKKSLYLVVP